MARGKGEDRRESVKERECPRHRYVVLRDDGWCEPGGAYVDTVPCPLVCPICRGPLTWDGGCVQCHGCTTGRRDDWTFPGDRYERDPRNPGHLMFVAKGPRPACTPVENAAALQILRAVLDGRMTMPEALAHQANIFQGREVL